MEISVDVGRECIPLKGKQRESKPGWTELVKPVKETAMYWRWLWVDAGKPNKGYLYEIMKQTRHRYHYAIRNIEKNRMDIKRQKLAENINFGQHNPN